MEHNLVPLFMLSEVVLEADATSKQHKMSPSIEDHSIGFKEVDMMICLQLHGMFL